LKNVVQSEMIQQREYENSAHW